jgi:hypothetical protein
MVAADVHAEAGSGVKNGGKERCCPGQISNGYCGTSEAPPLTLRAASLGVRGRVHPTDLTGTEHFGHGRTASGYVCAVYDAAHAFATTSIPWPTTAPSAPPGHRYPWPRELRARNVNPAAGLNASSARTAAVYGLGQGCLTVASYVIASIAAAAAVRRSKAGRSG